MEVQKKSLIDNWSLEEAGALLEGSEEYRTLPEWQFINCIGGLSNYVNALLLYDQTNFIYNGFEADWERFQWFKKNTLLFFDPVELQALNIDWNSNGSYENQGISNYLSSAEFLKTDLFVSPERATILKEQGPPKTDDSFTITLRKIDETIDSSKETNWFDKMKIGVDNNFKLPSLTHYVLSEASGINDLLRVIVQLKTDGKVKAVRNKIEEITSTTRGATRFQKDVEALIKEAFGHSTEKEKPWSVTVQVLFFSLSKSFHLDFFKRKEHLLFLKDVVKCRAEAGSLQNDVQRIFKREIAI